MNGLDGRIKFTLGTVLVLVFAAIACWFWFQWLESNGMRAGDSIEDVGLAAVPSGTLIISYGAEYEEGVRLLPAILDFSSPELVYVPLDQSTVGVVDRIVYHHSFSNNEQWATFTAVDDVDSEATSALTLGEQPHRVYLADLNGAVDTSEVLTRLQEATNIADDPSVKLFPSVSDDGDILYMSHPYGTSDAVYLESTADDWEIHLVTRSGESRAITAGTQPKWLDDNNFIYLKNDGVYLYNLSDSSETPLATTDVSVDVQSRLDITADNKLVAWTEPQIPTVHIFDVEQNEEEVILSHKGALAELAGSSVFSPDGRWLALQTPGYTDEDPTAFLNVVTVYNLETMAKWPSPPIFSDADPETTYITDWVQ
jgi:hypothetical protein